MKLNKGGKNSKIMDKMRNNIVGRSPIPKSRSIAELPLLHRYPYVVADFEATGLQWWTDKAFLVAFRLPDGKAFWVDLEDPRNLKWAREQMPKAKTSVFHGAKYDVHIARSVGINLDPAKVECTGIREALLNEHHYSYMLDDLGRLHFNIRKIDIVQELADLFGGKATKNVQFENLYRAPRPLVGKYAVRDADIAYKLYNKQSWELESEELLGVYNMERRLFCVLVDMEKRGVRVDLEKAHLLRSKLSKMLKKDHTEFKKLAGFDANFNSNPQMIRVFGAKKDDKGWITDAGERLLSTDKGGASFNKNSLMNLKDPRAKKIDSIRKIDKLINTFIDGHIIGSEHNGVVHTTFNQTKMVDEWGGKELGTGTGRLSSSNPNLQQIPKRDVNIAKLVRPLFLPDEGQDWVCRDWEQMDFRVFAHYVNEPTINEAYRKDPTMDFHQLVASMTGLPRTAKPGIKGNAKQINLGLVFGMGEGTLASEMGLPFTEDKGRNGKIYKRPGPEAKEIFKQYHARIPGIKDLLAKATSVANSRGFVKTALGRRLRFPKGVPTFKAGGLIFQGTAADCLKHKLVEVHGVLKGTGGRILLNIHDEFDMSIPSGNTEIDLKVKSTIESFGDDPIKLRIPILSDGGRGENWWEACK